MDLRSEQAILPSAPMAQSSMFYTRPLKTVDRILSHMDNPYYDVRYFTILERIVHVFHMQETWALAKVHYDKLKTRPPPASVCKCAVDVEANGIMKMLRFSALAMREPGLIYGENRRDYYVQYQVTYHFGNKLNDHGSHSDNLDEDTLLHPADSMPSLKDQAAWDKWRVILTSMPPEMAKDLAIYLYCALNR